jgi:hypothetical protein
MWEARHRPETASMTRTRASLGPLTHPRRALAATALAALALAGCGSESRNEPACVAPAAEPFPG